ncbi:MAG: hypothetical protein LBL82_03630 [Oscillospiraceae bacterium]|jgi:hypothetical protein|nr:hypothetical protein [Oscillospiraceae bacterium]
MIKSFSLCITEVDDVDDALEQLREQFTFEDQLLKNSVAIISCYADFVGSGVYKAVCDALPCEVAGTTTIANAVRGGDGDIMLNAMILTSDDVYFSVGLSSSIECEDETPLREAYEAAAARLPEKPKLILSFAPLLMNVGGDYFVKAFDAISGGIPNFGTMAVDHNEDYRESAVLCNGEASPNRYAFILMCGDVNPSYYITGMSNEKVFHEKCVVTASSGNQLQTVNNMPVIEYLESLGLEKNEEGTIPGINAFPFIVDLNDGMMPYICSLFALTPEGYAVCGGNIPVGATLSVGAINADYIISSSKNEIKKAVDTGKHSCMLIYSCIGRYFYLGYDPDSEIEKVFSVLDNTDITYHFAYSGCEICPVYAQDGTAKTVNRSHNVTLIVCAF